MDYDPGILAVPRRLFSQNYVDGGCEGDPPKNTTTDDTLGCYATNYLILVIGVLAACAFVRARERLERAGASGVERGLAAAYAAFFALTGLGYGAAGVLHHRFALAPPGWWAAAYVVVLLGNAGLCGVGALLTRGDAPSGKWKCGVAVTALANVAVILLVAATQNMLACGVFTAVTLLVMIGVWGKHAMRPCGCGEAAGLDLARACCKGARVCVAGIVKVAAGVVICVEINQCGRAARNRHHHAIEQASRRWRRGEVDPTRTPLPRRSRAVVASTASERQTTGDWALSRCHRHRRAGARGGEGRFGGRRSKTV